MKLLLDECTPKRLRSDFSGHAVYTVEEAGLKGLKNGVLLQIASSRFDILITVAQNIPFQQPLPNLQIAIVILVARSNRYYELRMLITKVQEALATIRAGRRRSGSMTQACTHTSDTTFAKRCSQRTTFFNTSVQVNLASTGLALLSSQRQIKVGAGAMMRRPQASLGPCKTLLKQ